ncbi:RTA1 like protein [Clathrospora elynae]|uniref:RTA1 like protein n=1 Tax=Clathrospora elynae TaxID=706981 RepID=A0A6A5T9Q1_9PLEO|nr:RTA1 like protein [Clathrospora elynae]
MSDSEAVPKYVLWPYTPSIAGSAIAAAVMFILFGIHTFRLVKNRTWFCIPLVIGAACETIGYSARAAAHSNTKSTTPYIIQSTLILLPPILFAASIYMILGRVMLRTGSAGYAVIRATWVTRIFVSGDILCFLIQAGGAGMLVSGSGSNLGESIILAGLILQIVIFAFFVAVAGIWHARLCAKPTTATAEVPWKRYVLCLYAASMCITIRNLCRVVEYGIGKDGYLLSHDWPLYVYDFLPMVVTLGVCVAWYDPNITPGRKTDIEFNARR